LSPLLQHPRRNLRFFLRRTVAKRRTQSLLIVVPFDKFLDIGAQVIQVAVRSYESVCESSGCAAACTVSEMDEPVRVLSGSVAALRSSRLIGPLYGLKVFSTTLANDINDLPTTSPHGSYFGATHKVLELHRFERSTRHSNGTSRQELRRPRKPLALRTQMSCGQLEG